MMEIFSGTSMEDMELNFGNLGSIFGGKKKRKKVTVKQAREILLNEEMDKLVDMDRVSELARQRVEEMGIIFIDEIDKIASRGEKVGIDVSREGVQRDILPIVEGSKVTTRHGIVDTRHILFIAGGRLPHEQAVGPHPRAAGPLPAARGAFRPDKGGFREDPHPAEERADHAVHGAPEDRGRDAWSSCRRQSTGSRRSPRRSTRGRRTSGRGGCTPSWSCSWRRSLSTRLRSRDRQSPLREGMWTRSCRTSWRTRT